MSEVAVALKQHAPTPGVPAGHAPPAAHVVELPTYTPPSPPEVVDCVQWDESSIVHCALDIPSGEAQHAPLTVLQIVGEHAVALPVYTPAYPPKAAASVQCGDTSIAHTVPLE